MDTTIAAPDMGEQSGDIGVKLDTLLLDGVRPQVGDSVDLNATGKVAKIIDDTAYITVETVNNEPVKMPGSTDDQMNELEASMTSGGMGDTLG